MEARTGAGHAATQHDDEQRLLPPGRWNVVADESLVRFRAKKLHLYFVKGRFTNLRGGIEAGPAARDLRANVVIQAASVTTRMPPRDFHLRTRDFLAVKRHPEIRISADEIQPDSSGRFVIPATFEIRGQRNRVELTAERHPEQHHGHIRLKLSGTLQLKDFKIQPLPPARFIVGSDVDLDVELIVAHAT